MSEKQETMPKKRINLQQLIREGKPIWVLNKSGEWAKRKGLRHKAGEVFFQIGTGDTRDKCVVPAGPDPVCITDQVDLESLKSCRDLLRLVNAGVLEPLDPDHAESYYERNAARRELVAKKVHKAKFSVQDEATPEKPKTASEESIPVDASIMAMVLKLKHGKMTSDEVIEKLNENFGNYSENDMEYLASTASDDGVRKWATAQLDLSRKGI